MIKKYSFWFKTAFIAQLITAGIHSLTFFNHPVPRNETEKQLYDLMNNYHIELGAGFSRSISNVLTAFSACFSLLLFFAGWINWYLWRMKADTKLLKGLIRVNVVVFGICFLLMVSFMFLPPIICIGVILFALLMAWVTFPSDQNSLPKT